MRWWDSDNVREVSTASGDGGDRTKRHYHGQVLIADEQDSSIIHEADLQSPHIVNVGQLHSSHNPTLEKRLLNENGRPLLSNDNLKETLINIYSKRKTLYTSSANTTIITDRRSVKEVCELIIKKLKIEKIYS